MDAPWELILQKITDLDVRQRSIADDLGEVKSDIKVANAAIKEIVDKVEKHERIIRGGNGDGVGLAATVKYISTTIEDDHGLLYGKDQQPGLKGRMKLAEEGIIALNKLGYLISGVALTNAAGIITLLLTHQIHMP